jgi:hypothetical protein
VSAFGGNWRPRPGGAPITGPVTVAVAPTETTVATVDTTSRAVCAIQVDNLDGSQTFTGTVYARVSASGAWAPTTLPDFTGLGPGASVAPAMDTTGYSGIQLRGLMSGAGGNVRVTYA